MKPLFTLLSLIIFMTPAWADLHKLALPLNTPSYDVSVIVEAMDSRDAQGGLECIDPKTDCK